MLIYYIVDIWEPNITAICWYTMFYWPTNMFLETPIFFLTGFQQPKRTDILPTTKNKHVFCHIPKFLIFRSHHFSQQKKSSKGPLWWCPESCRSYHPPPSPPCPISPLRPRRAKWPWLCSDCRTNTTPPAPRCHHHTLEKLTTNEALDGRLGRFWKNGETWDHHIWFYI